jgi:hypothetical protein
MNHAQHHIATSQARLMGGTKGRRPMVSQPILDAIKAAGSKGANSFELSVAAGLTRRHVNEACCNMRSRTGLIYSLGETKRHHVRHFWHEVPKAEAEAHMAKVEAERQAEILRQGREAAKRYKQTEKAKRKGDTATLEAIQAERIRRAEERAEARRRKAEEVEAARQRKRSADTFMNRNTRKMNALADKFRGTATPKERAKEVTIVWPESVKVQVCKGWTPRFSDLQPAGVIPKTIGHFTEKEISPWVKAVAA